LRLSSAKKMAKMRQMPPGAEMPRYRVMVSRREGMRAMAAPLTPMASVPPTMGMRWAADMVYMDLVAAETNQRSFPRNVSWKEADILEMPRFGVFEGFWHLIVGFHPVLDYASILHITAILLSEFRCSYHISRANKHQILESVTSKKSFPASSLMMIHEASARVNLRPPRP